MPLEHDMGKHNKHHTRHPKRRRPSSLLGMFHNHKKEKRILHGNHKFHEALLGKIQQNNPAEIFAMPREDLHNRLQEFAAELLTPTNENKANYWHSATQSENLDRAEDIVIEVVEDVEYINSDTGYNDYIDFIRANTSADQLSDPGTINKPLAEPGTTSIQPDLYIELLRPIFAIRHGGFEVHITGADMPRTVVNRPSVSPTASTKRSYYTKRSRRRRP